MSITIFQGSILDVEADCIVNPANSHLAHGGGLAAIIAKAATGSRNPPALDLEYVQDPKVRDWLLDHQEAGLIPTGGAAWTSAGLLPYNGIIHAVGPVWGGGAYYEALLLQCAHNSALTEAEAHGCKSIAFPAISCGIFGYPVEYAAPIAIRVATMTKLDVTFALFEDAHVVAYRDALLAHDRAFNAASIKEAF